MFPMKIASVYIFTLFAASSIIKRISTLNLASFLICSENPHIRDCNIEMNQFVFLCDEVAPEIRVLVVPQRC